MGKAETLATIWEQIHPVILELDPPKATGRCRVASRRMLDAIIFRMRSSRQWNRLPKELGDDSTIRRTFQRWVQLGVLERIWSILLKSARNWAGWSGNGRPPTAPWARAVLGGFSRPQAHGPGQGRKQAECSG